MGNYKMSYPALTNKFKKGDMVIVINGEGMAALKGAIAKVLGYSSDGLYVELEWVRNDKSKNQQNGNYYDANFELIDKIMANKDGTLNWKKRYL